MAGGGVPEATLGGIGEDLFDGRIGAGRTGLIFARGRKGEDAGGSGIGCGGLDGATDLGPAIEIGIAQDTVVIGAGEGIGIGADNTGGEFELFLLGVDGADFGVVGQAQGAELFAPGVAGVWGDVFGGKEADANGLEVAGFGHFPAELGEFVFGNVGGPLNGLDEATTANFKINDFANAFFDAGVIVGIDKRRVFGEMRKTPSAGANDFAKIVD